MPTARLFLQRKSTKPTEIIIKFGCRQNPRSEKKANENELSFRLFKNRSNQLTGKNPKIQIQMGF
jgi:hypothetical protein